MMKKAFVLLCCLGIVAPHVAQATTPAQATPQGIAIVSTIEDVSMRDGVVRGSIVDANGSPVANSPVVVAQQGKVIQELTTDEQGQFEAKGLTSGVYQVASYAKAQNYRVWERGAPANAKEGVVHVMSNDVARAQFSGRTYNLPLVGAVRHPLLLIAMTAGTATAIIMGNDDNS